VNYTLGYGLMALLFGIYVIADRDDPARSAARGQRRLQRWLRISLPGRSEQEQKVGWVVLGVACVFLGVAMIIIGVYWWVTS